jgi:hypothetical protein
MISADVFTSSLALTGSFSPSILLILDTNMLDIYYIQLTTFVPQPLRSMPEPRFASYTSPTSYRTSSIMEKSLDIWNTADIVLIRR